MRVLCPLIAPRGIQPHLDNQFAQPHLEDDQSAVQTRYGRYSKKPKRFGYND